MTALRIPVGHDLRLRPGRHPDLADVAADLEPWSVLVSGALREQRRFGTRITLSVEDRSGHLLGALVLDRLAATEWSALPLVVDPRSAPVLARLIDRSWAVAIEGTSRHVEPLLDHLRRGKGSARSPFFGTPPDEAHLVGERDPRTRSATLADVDAIAALFQRYWFERMPSPRSRRRDLARMVTERLAVVVEEDGRVVGALLADALGRDWLNASDGMVAEEHRGRGLSWPMLNRMMGQTLLMGIGLSGAVHTDNKMGPLRRVRELGVDESIGLPTEEQVYVRMQERPWLGPPKWRRRQVRRAHRWLDELDGRTHRARTAWRGRRGAAGSSTRER